MTLTADVQGTTPFPMNVWATGIFASSANAVSASAAPEIRRSGSQGRETQTGIAGESAMDVRHERRGLLVSRQYEPNGAVVKGIHQFEVLLARDAEGEADALVLKAVDQQRRGLHGSQMPPRGLVHSVQAGPGEAEPLH